MRLSGQEAPGTPEASLRLRRNSATSWPPLEPPLRPCPEARGTSPSPRGPPTPPTRTSAHLRPPTWSCDEKERVPPAEGSVGACPPASPEWDGVQRTETAWVGLCLGPSPTEGGPERNQEALPSPLPPGLRGPGGWGEEGRAAFHPAEEVGALWWPGSESASQGGLGRAVGLATRSQSRGQARAAAPPG